MSRQRGVAQFGSAPALGAGGQRFESSHPDQSKKDFNTVQVFDKLLFVFGFGLISLYLMGQMY